MKKFAIALYDNEAESDDELTFKKNDLMQVMQIDYMGMSGWWLCRLIKQQKQQQKKINSTYIGLAAGNRLKIISDEKLLSKLSKLVGMDPATSSSNSSNSLSSNTSNSSAESSSVNIIKLKTPSPFIPAKQKSFTNSSNSSKKNSQINDDEDDYDYDIPENNKPIKQQETRKSTSPTIDSGISASSLVSLNPSSAVNSKSQLQIDFEARYHKLKHLIEYLTDCLDNNEIKAEMIRLKSDLNDFLVNSIKEIKQLHASFHPSLNVFNKFKSQYRQLKDIYFYYESTFNKFNSFYLWNFELIAKENELNDLNMKLKHLSELIDLLKQLIDDNRLFDYHEQSKNEAIAVEEDQDSAYQYVYDNNNVNKQEEEEEEDIKHFELESDYCSIEEEEEEEEESSEDYENIYSDLDSLTLKKNEEKLRRETKVTGNKETGGIVTERINTCDQMLLKFYLKHIEDNLSELKLIYDLLIGNLVDNEPVEDFNELAHKLALNGHKLLFICDTLERNLSNLSIKTSLAESSNDLCGSLKSYMIRLKSVSAVTSNNKLITDSLHGVFDSARTFKQIILKYYFKSH